MFVVSIIYFKRRLLTISRGDPAYRMYEQISLGDVDFVTGDYLAGIS